MINYICDYLSVHKIEPSKNLKIILGDISEKKAIRKTLENADVIIYTIGIIREFKHRNICFDSLHRKAVNNIIKSGRVTYLK